jgi:hypothetical protein
MKSNNFYSILIVFLLGVVSYLLWDKHQNSVPVGQEKFMAYLDSINQQNKLMFNKLDSLTLVKKEQLRIYEKINLKYDTIQIAIDTMPDLEGTKLLLSISRQLTSKGVE